MHGVFDIETAYALSYQESSCRTREEIRRDFEQKGQLDNPTWKGGIMQVDSCWRWGSPSKCNTIQEQIHSGLREIDFGLRKIQEQLNHLGITGLTEDQKLSLLFVAYNRGFYVSNEAMEYYSQDYYPSIIKVNCTEKDVCMNDSQEIDISAELIGLDNFEKSLLIACRKNYGFMNNGIGDYCTGQDYGFNYPKKINWIREAIKSDEFTARNREWVPDAQKEFYIDSIEFSGYDWFIKTSINLTGPGPNYFYLNELSVEVDEHGYLHLYILKGEKGWYSSELVNTKHLGYGIYSFTLEGPINIETSTVVGLFTYDLGLFNDSEWHHREIDIEFSRWNNPIIANTQYLIQGDDLSLKRFETDTDEDIVILFEWREGRVHFQQYITDELVNEWVYEGETVPEPGNEQIRINLWSFDTHPISAQHLIIKKFEYIP